jgi:hypothetical protein
LQPVFIGFLTSVSLVFAATVPYLKLLGEAEQRIVWQQSLMK